MFGGGGVGTYYPTLPSTTPLPKDTPLVPTVRQCWLVGIIERQERRNDNHRKDYRRMDSWLVY